MGALADLKACSRCGEVRRTSEFYLQRGLPMARCRECVKEQARIHARKVAPERNEKLRIQRAKDPERGRQYARDRYACMAGEIKSASRAYRRANRDSVADRERSYKARNPEILLVARNNRRARKRAAVGKLTKAAVGAIFAAWDGLCAYCRCSTSNPHVDHKTPLSRGGTNLPDNLHITCKACNSRKHVKTHEEFLDLLWREEIV